MGLSVETYALAKKYTDDSMQGAGAVAGKPCQIQSITDITGGKRVTFLWVDNSGTSHTSTMDVMNGQDGDDGQDGKGIQSVSVNALNHLILTYTDGTTVDAGEIEISSAVTSVCGKTGNVTLDAEDVGALADDTPLPTKVSDLTNDSAFIQNTVDNLTNYYLKAQTYTKDEVNTLVNNISAMTIDIVETLPTTDISTTTIYLIETSAGSNVYVQWAYINNEWAQLGTTQVDLTNYYTKSQTDTLLADKQDTLTFDNVPTSGSTNPVKSAGVLSAINDAVATKQDTLTFDNAPTSSSNNPVKSDGIFTALAGKQDTLLFDNVPTDNSANPVKSGGVFTALSGKQDTLTFDATPTENSTNPVTSGGVYDALADVGGVDVYSTTEVKTNKVWIDGKPIYRTVVNTGALPTATQTKRVDVVINNVDVVTSLAGICKNTTSGRTSTLPFVTTNQDYNVSLDYYTGYIEFYSKQNLSTFNVSYVIIEYTKTT